MSTLARAIIRGRLPASLIAAAGFLLAFLLLGGGGLLSFAGALLLMGAGAPAVVIAWHIGLRGIAEVGALGGVIIGLALLQWTLPLIWLLGLWLPLAGAGLALRGGAFFSQVALILGLLVIAGLGLWTVGVALALGDPETLVQDRLNQAMTKLVQEQAQGAEARRQGLDQVRLVVPILARFFPGAVGSGILAVWGGNLLVGLYLADRVGALPNWGSALRAFRLPDALIWLAIGLGGLAWIGDGTPIGYWALSSLLVIGILYMAQGLAVIHSARLAFGVARGWLVGFYVLFALFLQLGLAVALLGVMDIWADFRNRLGEK